MGIVTVAEYVETNGNIVVIRCPCGANYYLLLTHSYWKPDDILRCHTCDNDMRIPPEMSRSSMENPDAIIGKVVWC